MRKLDKEPLTKRPWYLYDGEYFNDKMRERREFINNITRAIGNRVSNPGTEGNSYRFSNPGQSALVNDPSPLARPVTKKSSF